MPERRPRSIAAVAVVLFLLGVLSALSGMAVSAASSCCGSSDPSDTTPTVLGFMLAAPIFATGLGLWSGRMSRRVLLLCAAAPLAVLAAASPYSVDLSGLVPVGLLAWLWLFWYLRRPVALGWVGRRTTRDQR
jgi:hypothetical protein